MRFSLRTLLLTLFVLALVASHFYTSWKLNQARSELLMLRNEVGYLTIVDPERLNIIYAPKGPGRRWRVYVPKGAHYTLHAFGAKIPAKGVPSEGSEFSMQLPEGEFTLAANTRREKDHWQLLVNAGRHGGGGIGIRDEDAGWLEPGSGGAEIPALAGHKGVETFDLHQSFDLLRQHEWRWEGSGSTPGPKPSDGILLWIEAQ